MQSLAGNDLDAAEKAFADHAAKAAEAAKEAADLLKNPAVATAIQEAQAKAALAVNLMTLAQEAKRLAKQKKGELNENGLKVSNLKRFLKGRG